MIPFENTSFFYVILLMLLVIWVTKLFFKESNYKFVLFGLNVSFFLLFFSQPIHFTLFIIWSFFITYLFTNVLIVQKKIWGVILLLSPMLLVKFDISQKGFHWNDVISFAGLSYATFKAVGYFMDRASKEKMIDPITYFNFLAFIPTLLIGPIDRMSNFVKSQESGYSNITWENSTKAWDYFILGILFKYVGAEIVDRYWLSIFPENSSEVLHMLNYMYSYYFYLFFDFAGYSFMVLGISKFMGIIVPLNFKNPFLAKNPQEFWQTFHISLGDWLKTYFFTPLYTYFTRKKSLKQYPIFRQNTALFLTFFLMGCWNGFSKQFILSGSLFGLYSVIHNTYSIYCKKKQKDIIFGKLSSFWVNSISVFIMFNAAAFALYIFSGKFPFLK